MKVQLGPTDLRIEWDTDDERKYLMTKLDSIHFAYNPTYIIYVNGVRIEGKQLNET